MKGVFSEMFLKMAMPPLEQQDCAVFQNVYLSETLKTKKDHVDISTGSEVIQDFVFWPI